MLILRNLPKRDINTQERENIFYKHNFLLKIFMLNIQDENLENFKLLGVDLVNF